MPGADRRPLPSRVLAVAGAQRRRGRSRGGALAGMGRRRHRRRGVRQGRQPLLPRLGSGPAPAGRRAGLPRVPVLSRAPDRSGPRAAARPAPEGAVTYLLLGIPFLAVTLTVTLLSATRPQIGRASCRGRGSSAG